jgi:hypothetical protein
MCFTKNKEELEDLYNAAKPEEFYRESWEQYAHSYFWLQKAQALYDSAKAVQNAFWPKTRKHHDQKAAVSDFHKGPVYMLLAGSAIEAILKGIWLGQNPSLVTEQELPKDFTKHDLESLYDKTGLIKNSRQNDLLKRLTNYVTTFGKYPITKTKYDMVNKLKTRFSSQTDFDSVDQLWNLLKKKIKPFAKIKEVRKNEF